MRFDVRTAVCFNELNGLALRQGFGRHPGVLWDLPNLQTTLAVPNIGQSRDTEERVRDCELFFILCA